MRTSSRRYLPLLLLPVSLAMIVWTCGGGDGGGPAAFSQADITGTWDYVEFNAGANPGCMWGNVTADASGNLVLNYNTDSRGVLTYPGPPSPLFTKWVIDGSGTIREYVTLVSPNVLNPSLYGNMASSKDVAVATDNVALSPFTYLLRVVRKRVASVTYDNADIDNTTFVFHQLNNEATDNSWRYGYGSIDGSGNVAIDNETSPFGTEPGPPGTVSTLHVDSAGIVTSTDNTFNGFLTADKTTMFGLIVEPSATRFIVIQFLGRTTYAQADLAGMWRWNVLFGSDAPGWVKGSWTINAAGAATYDSATYLVNTGWTVPPTTPETVTISSNGTLTNSLAPPVQYHGMLSSGKKLLWVRAKTHSPTRYSIAVSVR